MPLCDARVWKILCEHHSHDQYLEPAGPVCPPQGLAEHMGVPKPPGSVAAAFKMSVISWHGPSGHIGRSGGGV